MWLNNHCPAGSIGAPGTVMGSCARGDACDDPPESLVLVSRVEATIGVDWLRMLRGREVTAYGCWHCTGQPPDAEMLASVRTPTAACAPAVKCRLVRKPNGRWWHRTMISSSSSGGDALGAATWSIQV